MESIDRRMLLAMVGVPASALSRLSAAPLPPLGQACPLPLSDVRLLDQPGLEAAPANPRSSIWRRSGDTLLVDLYIPSTARWADQGAGFRMEAAYPSGERVEIVVEDLDGATEFGVALRMPDWRQGAKVSVNGEPVSAGPAGDYTVLRRVWRQGDRIVLDLPPKLLTASTHDDSSAPAADQPYDGPASPRGAHDPLTGQYPGDFFDVDDPIPQELTRGKESVTVRFQPADDTTHFGPVFGVRVYAPAGSSRTT